MTLVNLRPQEMLPAIAGGSIDAFDTWEPHIANARKALGEGAGRSTPRASTRRPSTSW